MRAVIPGHVLNILRRHRRRPRPPAVRAAVDGLPAVVLTVPSPALFVLADGLAVRAFPDPAGPLLPGDAVRLRHDAHRLVASPVGP
ncbi:hypothetical protein [Catenulispora subtropica]|uniref:Uncharacterized protein n=1 Tax=Catenulispora subtropica TaxID=450798 RepID=A0ABP5CBD4_9ACTN